MPYISRARDITIASLSLLWFLCYSVTVTTYTEVRTGSSALIIGSVLGALALVAATVLIVVSVILCSIKKGTIPGNN